jgi:hypothetical protein
MEWDTNGIEPLLAQCDAENRRAFTAPDDMEIWGGEYKGYPALSASPNGTWGILNMVSTPD